MSPLDEGPLAEGNIQLDYRMNIYVHGSSPDAGDDVYHTDGAEVFKDEHGIQWIKFFAKNGYDAGREHVIRTDSAGFRIVRTS